MKIPSAQPFSTIPVGGVCSPDGVAFFIKCDPTTACNLSTGIVQTGIDPNSTDLYFPAAALVLG